MKLRALSVCVTSLCMVVLAPAPAEAQGQARALLGSWSGKATAPDGGPPSGDIQVTFVRGEDGVLQGKLMVRAEGGLQYSGEVTGISFLKRTLAAKVIFKLGENPLEVDVTGPLKGRTISGGFTVSAKGEKIGEGSFSITRDPPAADRPPSSPKESKAP